jgi:hypothetical protein
MIPNASMEWDVCFRAAFLLIVLNGWPLVGLAQDVVVGADSDVQLEASGTQLLDNDLPELNPPTLAEASRPWFEDVSVGYDNGFIIASGQQQSLVRSDSPFLLKFNGWSQLRHTVTDFAPPRDDLNQFQLVRGRLVFSGNAWSSDLSYFIQLDGRSTSGDDIRLLDYFLRYDIGHHQLGLRRGTFGFRTGKYKVPFTMARWLSGRDFEFADRSVASIFFDVNRSFAWGLYGETGGLGTPVKWEVALLNGLVTGGAETGSSGTLDDNFAYSGRLHAYPIGDWGSSNLQDFQDHRRLALRVGVGFAGSTVDREGTTEFTRLRVVDSGETLASILPPVVDQYHAALFATDLSVKFRGWSSTLEYYFRTVDDFQPAMVPELFDHGFWFQLGKFIIPGKVQLAARWSRVEGNSGTLGGRNVSTEEIGGAFGWYFRQNQAKLVIDATHLNGAPISSSALDITPGDTGWLFRSQIQFSF